MLKLYGEDHPSTAECYRSIGVTQHEMKDYVSALQSTRKALDIMLKLYGEDHPSTAESYRRIGIIQQEMNNYDSALNSEREELDIMLKLSGEDRDIDILQNVMKYQGPARQSEWFSREEHEFSADVAVSSQPDRQDQSLCALSTSSFSPAPEPLAVEIENEIPGLFQEALRHGEKKNNRIALFLIGQGGVGKTSLKKSLLGEESNNEQEASTVGIEFDVVEVNNSDKGKAWCRSADQQFMASEEYFNVFIAKETARSKANREKEPQNKGVERETDSTILSKELTYEHEKHPDTKGVDREIDSTIPPKEVSYEHINGLYGHQEGNSNRGEKSQVENEIETKEKESGKIKTKRTDDILENRFLSNKMKRKIQEAWENIQNYRDETMDTVRFLFGDVGGQSVYYDIHSILLRSRSLFLFLVDLEKPLNGKAQPVFVDKETMKEVHLENPLEETNLDFAKKWIAALRDLCPDDKKMGQTSTPNTSQPKVIVVFTKPDKLDSGEVERRKEDAYKMLVESFKEIGCEFFIVANYTIKNTLPRNEEETRELRSLRSKIFETAQEVLKNQEKMPINWLVFERTLAALMESEDHRYISLDEARELADQCDVKDTFPEAMKFFHEENIVVHFYEKKPLSELVVLDEAWLVELLTRVITVRPDSNCGGAVETAWNDLKKKGKLDFANLPNVLEQYKQKEALKEMMVRCRLICHWKGDIYFVPSMVTKAKTKQEIREVLSKCLEPSLYIDFNGDCIPLGFFTRLQVEFIKWVREDEKGGSTDDNDKAKDSTPPEIQCNLSRFNKQERNGVVYAVYLIRFISRIQVAVRGEEWGNIAKSVLFFLRDAISNICQNLPSFKSRRVGLGLQCDLCCEEREECQRHKKEACTDGDCLCILDLRRFQERNVVCKKNFRGKLKSELTESPWVQAAARSDMKRKRSETEKQSGPRKQRCTEPGPTGELESQSNAVRIRRRCLTKTEIGSRRQRRTESGRSNELESQSNAVRKRRRCQTKTESGPCKQRRTESTSSNQLERGSCVTMVSQIPYLMRRNICELLDLTRPFGGDFQTLAARLHMKPLHIQLLRQSQDKTEAVLSWWETQSSATVQRFREVLREMNRDDVLEIVNGI